MKRPNQLRCKWKTIHYRNGRRHDVLLCAARLDRLRKNALYDGFTSSGSNQKVTVVPRNMVVTCMPLIVLCGTVIDGDRRKKTHPPEPKIKVWRVNWVLMLPFAVFTLADIAVHLHAWAVPALCLPYRSVL